ncbi:hydroxylamine reductase [Desulfothermus okinawensis JCM 13304]
MFCNQCQETAKNQGCTKVGVCGKKEDLANLQDLLIYLVEGISIYANKLKEIEEVDSSVGRFVCEAMFSTITNVGWDNAKFEEWINRALKVREDVKERFLAAYKNKYGKEFSEPLDDAATWTSSNPKDFYEKAKEAGWLRFENEDLRSLKQTICFGVKGICAYADHAALLGFEDKDIYNFIFEAMAAMTEDLSADELLNLVLKTGEYGVKVMALLDEANTSTYGHPEISEVYLGVRNNPGILISGHDLKDLEELLEQTKGTGIDVYTHGEMLPAHYYPAFKKYDHFVGNYGSSWWHQNKEFESFNGPIILTTNCLIPVRGNYLDRLFTTGVVNYPGATHIDDRPKGGTKDFSKVIERAKSCPPPTPLEDKKIVGGFARNQVLALADKVVDAVKSGAIKRFIVMAGCDGRQKKREYFTEVAKNLPKDTVILTAGCAKYRYIKLDLGDIGGIPRILDAGQCNDSYSLAVIALKLKEVFGVDDINDLPISFDIGWYEQKAITVFLALLYLGFKGMRVGPTLPGFLSPNVAKILVEKFDLKPIGDVKEDIEAMMQGK